MSRVSKQFSAIVTASRASSRTVTNSAGTLVSRASGEFAIDHDPITLAVKGLIVEEQRTNSVRNPRGEGAVVGSPGTRPTNWTSGWNALASGIQPSIAGTGTENGIEYTEVNFAGTATATGTILVAYFESPTQIAALAAQTWTGTFYAKLSAGSLGNATFANRVQEFTAAGASVPSATTDTVFVPTSASLLTQRVATTRTLTDATTAYVLHGLRVSVTNGVTYDFTLRIGGPQLEIGTFATSLILPPAASPAAATRLADSLTIATLSPWYNAVEGTLYVEVSIPYDSSASIFPVAASFNDGTFANAMQVFTRAVDDLRVVSVRVGGVTTATVSNGSAYVYGAVSKVAFAYRANDVALSADGAAAGTGTPATLPVVDRMIIGGQIAGSLSQLNGHLRKTIFYPIRKIDTQLVTLST